MKHVLLLMIIFTLSACASAPSSVGKTAEAESKAFDKISRQYSDGEDSVKEGEKLIRKGRKLVDEGRDDVRKGEAMVFNGNRVAQNSRNLYIQQTGLNSVPLDPSKIADPSTREIKKIVDRWEDGAYDVEKGNKLIVSGNKDIANGEKKIREGQSKVENGTAKMRKAENAFSARKKSF